MRGISIEFLSLEPASSSLISFCTFYLSRSLRPYRFHRYQRFSQTSSSPCLSTWSLLSPPPWARKHAWRSFSSGSRPRSRRMSPASPGSNGIVRSMGKVKEPQISSALNSKNAYQFSICLIERLTNVFFSQICGRSSICRTFKDCPLQ